MSNPFHEKRIQVWMKFHRTMRVVDLQREYKVAQRRLGDDLNQLARAESVERLLSSILNPKQLSKTLLVWEAC